MKEEDNNIKFKQLTRLIDRNYNSNEAIKIDYLIIDYLIDTLFQYEYTDEEKDILKQILNDSFNKAMNNSTNNIIINDYIDILSKKLKNNETIKFLKNNKDNYIFICTIISICNNKINTKDKEFIIKTTIEEHNNRMEYLKSIGLVSDRIKKVSEINIQSHLDTYLEKFENEKKLSNYSYKDYLQNEIRTDFIKELIELLINNDLEPNNELFVINNLDDDNKKFYFSLLFDGLNNYKKETPTNKKCYISILDISDEEILKQKNVLKFAIKEKEISLVKQTYNMLKRYMTNLDIISFKSLNIENNKDILIKFQNQMEQLLRENNLITYDNYCSLYPETKQKIQYLWDYLVNNRMNASFQLWLNDSNRNIFNLIYQENLRHLLELIKNYNRKLYFSKKNDNKNIEERFIHSLEESIQKNTIKILDENEELVIRSINQKKLDELNLKQSELIPHLKQLLSGKELDPENADEVTKKIYNINEHYYWQFKYKKYNPSFYDEDKEETNVQNMAIILENNNNIVKDLLSNMETFLRYKKANQKGRNNSEIIINSTKKHIEDELYLDKTINFESNNLKKVLEIFENERKIYHFTDFITDYLIFLNMPIIHKIIKNISNEIVRNFYKIYNKIIEISYDNNTVIVYNNNNFIEYITLEAEKYIQINIHNYKDLECFNFGEFKGYLYIRAVDYLLDFSNKNTEVATINTQYEKNKQ